MSVDRIYQSKFLPEPGSLSYRVLREGKILSPEETPQQMVERVIKAICSVEDKWNVPKKETILFANDLGAMLDEGKVVFSTPIMTNAGKTGCRPLSACSVPPVDLRGDLEKVKNIVDQYHQDGMGTGFDLTNVDDPVRVLKYLNEVAIEGANSGKEDRPVGNMAICRADHPRIVEFITSKLNNPGQWKFNISVDVPESLWLAIVNNDEWKLRDGQVMDARHILELIAQTAYECADPGIIFLDRLNSDNPVPGVGEYTSVAPCAEVGLVEGETCQFGYINLAKFLSSEGKINLDDLRKASYLLVRALDNALEISVDSYAFDQSRKIMSAKRKIGVGICGLADLLMVLKLPYDSEEGREIASDVIAFINYQTKLASVELAKKRGSFGAMNSIVGCRYNENPGYIEQRYGGKNSEYVSVEEWHRLGEYIRETRLLRNCSTIALPPTGRSGLVVGASTGVEPHFTLRGSEGILSIVLDCLKSEGLDDPENIQTIYTTGSCAQTSLPEDVKRVFATATEISPLGHLGMVAALQTFVDEAISKTINLPNTASYKDVLEIYEIAGQMGLKGITIYRDGSLSLQPKKVVKE